MELQHHHLILGACFSEIHIKKYLELNPDVRVITVDNSFNKDFENIEIDNNMVSNREFNNKIYTSSTSRAVHYNADFNTTEFWLEMLERYGGYVSKIIFDSSTCKFINNSQDCWRLCCNVFTLIEDLLTADGAIYFDSLDTGIISYPRDMFQELRQYGKTKGIINFLPLLQANIGEAFFNYDEFMDQHRVNYVQDRLERFYEPSNKHYQEYIRQLDEFATLSGFQIKIEHTNKQPYPLQSTTYPINRYLILYKQGGDASPPF